MPSLIALLLGIAVAYFLVPKLAPNVLMIVGSVILAWAIYSHVQRFGVTQYERATWTYKLSQYSGFILVGVVLLVGYVMYYMNGQSGSGNMLGTPMPPVTMPTVGGGFGMIAKTVSSRVGELLRKGRISLD